MGRRKIDRVQLGNMLRAEVPTKEIAEHFGVSGRAVRKAAESLAQSVTSQAVKHQAKKILQQDLDAREQLLTINDSANRLLQLLEKQLQQEQAGVVDGLKVRLLALEKVLGEDRRERWEVPLEALVSEIEGLIVARPATIELLLKAQAEIRQQIGLVVKVAAELLEAKRVNEVHRVMLEEIKLESPECQMRIVRRLKGSQLLLQVLDFA